MLSDGSFFVNSLCVRSQDAWMVCSSYNDEPATTHINMRSCVPQQPVVTLSLN